MISVLVSDEGSLSKPKENLRGSRGLSKGEGE